MKVVVMVRGVRDLERRKALRLISKERFCSGEDETLEEAADKEGERRSGVSTVLLAVLHLASPHFQRRSACGTT
jgi:hypothetical protein